jgi:hypothetical protein
MKKMKMLFLVSALVLMVSYGYAQSEDQGNTTSTEASAHGTAMSDLAKNTTVTGKERGVLISSAARAKSLTVANANARFIRGDAKPVQANANASVNGSTSATLNGKPAVLPPVTPPTMGQPATTPVGKPIGVPVAIQGQAHMKGN